MAIDRGPFNLLQDDDGSNLVGSVWNKAAIDTVVLTPTDAALAATDAALADTAAAVAAVGAWSDVPFNATHFAGVSPFTWTVGPAAVLRNRYAVMGHVLVWSFYISWFSGSNTLGGSPGDTLQMTMPGGRRFTDGLQSEIIAYAAGMAGVPVVGGLRITQAHDKIDISKSAGGTFALSDIPGMITTIILEIE